MLNLECTSTHTHTPVADILQLFGGIVDAMFKRVNLNCAHQVRPPLNGRTAIWGRGRRSRMYWPMTAYSRPSRPCHLEGAPRAFATSRWWSHRERTARRPEAEVSGLVELVNVRNVKEFAGQNHGGYSSRVGDVNERIGVNDSQVRLLAYFNGAFFAIST
jgi:hypothetical protein